MRQSLAPPPTWRARRRLVLGIAGAGGGLAVGARAAGPASGTPATVARFDRIEIDVTADVAYQVSERTQVAVDAPPHVREHLRIESRDGLLRIYSVGSWSTDRPVRIRIDGPAALQAARVHGAAALGLTALRGDSFALEADGSARVVLADGHWRRLVVALDDSAEAEARGVATQLRLEARASSQWQGAHLVADEVRATTRDSATATVHGRRDIDARASDASSIRTRGAAVVRRRVEDAASIEGGG